MLLQRLFLCWFCLKRKDWVFFYVLINFFHCSLLQNQIQPNLLPPKSWQGIETTSHVIHQVRFCHMLLSLSNWCTIALVNGLAGIFISCYWVSWIGFCLKPSSELLWHLSTQVNNGPLYVYITVFDPRRGNRRCFIHFLVYALVYRSIASNLVTLGTLSPKSYSAYTQTYYPFLSKPLLKWSRTVETGLLINW